MKNGGLILWNAVVICEEMSKTSWQMGFRLVQWLNIILFLRRASQGSTTLGKKVLPGIYALFAGRIWQGDMMVADVEALGKHGRVGNPSFEEATRKKYW